MADDQAQKVEAPRQELIGPKGRFVKGNQFGKRHGRKKGEQNAVSKTMKEAMLETVEQIGSDGNGRGGKSGYLTQLAKTNPDLFAHHLLKATVPPARETDGNTENSGGPVIINVHSALEGNQYAPGLPDVKVLLPFEECTKAWTAYRAGNAQWQIYLKEIEPQLPLATFENLSRVEAPGDSNVAQPLLQLAAPVDDDPEETVLDFMNEPDLDKLSMRQLMIRAGVKDDVD